MDIFAKYVRIYLCNVYMYVVLIMCYNFIVRWSITTLIIAPWAESRYIMPVSEAHKKASINYAKKNLKRIPLDVTKEKYEDIATAAKTAGESVNGYIKKAVDERMERDLQQDDL